jgi:hypothetical protein
MQIVSLLAVSPCYQGNFTMQRVAKGLLGDAQTKVDEVTG